jgi:hypothetical protein
MSSFNSSYHQLTHVITHRYVFAAIWRIIKLFIAPETREKIQIVGGDPFPTLSKYIDPKNIPAYIKGGLRKNDNGDPSCDQWIPPGGKIPSPLPAHVQKELDEWENGKHCWLKQNAPKDWQKYFKK